MIREKQHRLPEEAYRGIQIVSITACVKHRIPLFTTQSRFVSFREMLLTALKRFGCGSDVYLFMPDHVHLLIRGESGSADVQKAMRSFKQHSGFWLSRHCPSVRWQKDYYDHIIRNSEDLERHIQYVLENPVRAGIVAYWKDYPFKGSTIYDLDAWD